MIASSSDGTLWGVKRGLVGLLLIAGAYLSWWVVQRDPQPAFDVLAAEQTRGAAGMLARVSAVCFVSALLALLRPRWIPRMFRPPAHWWRPLVLAASVASALLFVLYLGPWSILPLTIDAILIWGVMAQGWNVAALSRGREDIG